MPDYPFVNKVLTPVAYALCNGIEVRPVGHRFIIKQIFTMSNPVFKYGLFGEYLSVQSGNIKCRKVGSKVVCDKLASSVGYTEITLPYYSPDASYYLYPSGIARMCGVITSPKYTTYYDVNVQRFVETPEFEKLVQEELRRKGKPYCRSDNGRIFECPDVMENRMKLFDCSHVIVIPYNRSDDADDIYNTFHVPVYIAPNPQEFCSNFSEAVDTVYHDVEYYMGLVETPYSSLLKHLLANVYGVYPLPFKVVPSKSPKTAFYVGDDIFAVSVNDKSDYGEVLEFAVKKLYFIIYEKYGLVMPKAGETATEYLRHHLKTLTKDAIYSLVEALDRAFAEGNFFQKFETCRKYTYDEKVICAK